MSELDQPENQTVIEESELPSFSKWVREEMARQNLKTQELAATTGPTYVGIWNIIKGNTKTPRQETREKIAQALKAEVPDDVQAEISQETADIPGYLWADFTPFDESTIPENGGVYVFYYISDRPVYVGMSRENARNRINDHQTRFWFKLPVATRGAFLSVPDPEMCKKIESILIKFLGRHLLINDKQVKPWE